MSPFARDKVLPAAQEVDGLVDALAREAARGARARKPRVDRISARLALLSEKALPAVRGRLEDLGEPGCVVLARMGPLAVPGLVADLRSPSDARRRLAARALGLSGSAAAVAPLRAALDDEDPAVGRAAEFGLETLARTWARALRDGSLRDQAMAVLTAIGAPAVWPLAHLLRDRDLGLFAAKTLGQIGEPAVRPALLVLVHARRSPEREASDPAFVFAASALAFIGAPALEPAAELLRDGTESPDVRAGAAFVLARMGEAAVPSLRQALTEHDADVRAVAAEALARAVA